MPSLNEIIEIAKSNSLTPKIIQVVRLYKGNKYTEVYLIDAIRFMSAEEFENRILPPLVSLLDKKD